MKSFKIYLILATIAITGFILRLYRINFPLADWHSWRQVDTAGVTREYVENGIDLLRPKYMDISSIPSGKLNPEGWRMVEFPFINASVASTILTLKNFGFATEWQDIVPIERSTSILFSLGSTIMLFFMVKKTNGYKTALIAAAFFAVLPFNIYFSRTVLPEPKLVFLALFSTYFFYRFVYTGNWLDWSLALTGGALATLVKPTWILIFGLSWLYLVLTRRRKDLLKIKWGLAFIFLSILIVIPFILWRAWIVQFPSGIPASDWLFNAGGIRWRPAWFRWLFADRLGRLILGFWGTAPFVLGILMKPRKTEGWFFHWWLVGGLIYLSTFASGNITHDYYQIILIPIIAIFMAKGFVFIWKCPEYFSRPMCRPIAVMISVFALAFSWFYVRDFFNINHLEIVEAGKAADQLIPKQAVVIAPYGGDTAFLFQINRQGWPVGGVVNDKISQGATHYVSVNFDEETNKLMQTCQVVLKTDKYVIIDLRNCPI